MFHAVCFGCSWTRRALDFFCSVSYDTYTMKNAITPAEYGSFQRAYDFLNAELFGGALPQPLFTLQRHARARGYFSPDRFVGRQEAARVAEIALNPDAFLDSTDEQIVSVLAHEMCHAWQHSFGKPGRKGYHNREWADKMISIGLQPSNTAAPGGRETGQGVAHYIVANGRYAHLYAKLAAEGFKLQWQSPSGEGKKKPKESKVKYTCPGCKTNVWGKPGIDVACIKCVEQMVA
jgi:predicted SprT family Zn-dependent metalloprotease